MLALSHVTTFYNKTAQGFLFVVTVGGARLKYENFCQIVILPSEYNKNIWIQFTFNHTNTDTNTNTTTQTQTQTHMVIWHILVNLCIYSSPFPLALLNLFDLSVDREGWWFEHSTLCHSCGFACQQKLLKTFPDPDCLRSVDEVV